MVTIEDSNGKKDTLVHRITIVDKNPWDDDDQNEHRSCRIDKAKISSPVLARVNQSIPFQLTIPHCLQTQFALIQWNFGDGTNSGGVTHAFHSYKKTGFYKVIVRFYKKSLIEQPSLTLEQTVHVVDGDDSRQCGDSGSH